jgi:hypothetical protein
MLTGRAADAAKNRSLGIWKGQDRSHHKGWNQTNGGYQAHDFSPLALDGAPVRVSDTTPSISLPLNDES